MAPRNIILNAVDGDKTLLKKAQTFFMLACYPVVGYKQIARFLGIEIQYCPQEVPLDEVAQYFGSEDNTEIEEVVTHLPQDETVYFDGEGRALYVLPQPFSRWSQAAKIAYYTKQTLIEEEQKVLPPEEKQGAQMTKEEMLERMSKILGRKIVIADNKAPTGSHKVYVRYDEFYKELVSELRQVPKRCKEDVQSIMKELYNKHKDNLESKDSVRNLIIAISENFDHYASYIRSNSKYLSMVQFTKECTEVLYNQNMGEDDIPF